MKTMIIFKNGAWIAWDWFNITHLQIFGKMPVTTVDLLKRMRGKTNRYMPTMKENIDRVIFI